MQICAMVGRDWRLELHPPIVFVLETSVLRQRRKTILHLYPIVSERLNEPLYVDGISSIEWRVATNYPNQALTAGNGRVQ